VGSKDSAIVDLSKLRISNDALDDVVEYAAQDSMWFDVKNKQVHLYGAASVKYTALTIKAGYILLDYAKNEITAEQLPDSTGQLAGLPEFNDGQQDFTATRLRYNFKTKKGIIYEARTKQEDLYVLGERAKFVGSGSSDTTKRANNVIYNQDALLTTCDAPHPHFGIRTKKLKVVPDKLVVTGFSNLEIGGIPTPLVIPFGFYPITKTRKAGLIIPKDFESRRLEGLGINNFGWYQPISQHMDATLLFNAYTSGSWGINGTLRYNYVYRNNGNFNLRYNDRVTEGSRAERISAKSFGIQWTHQQDGKAHPTRRFGGSVNIQTNRDQQRNQNDYQSVFQNQLSSNLTYSKSFPGRPFQFSAALRHSQNTQTRQMDITLPSAQFTMQRIFPFKRKVQIGKERWYEKVSLTYAAKLDNSLRTVDTLLFTQQTLDNARMGIQHTVNTDFNFKIFKYINVSPNLSYEENWYPYAIEKFLDDSILIVNDTVRDAENNIVSIALNESKSKFGFVQTRRDWNFYAFRSYNAGISATTNLFFTRQLKRGWFRGVRHKMTPTLSTGLGPDFSKLQDRYFKTYFTDLRPEKRDTLQYGIFDDAIYSRPGQTERQWNLNYSINNVLEMKFRNRRDSVDKKVRIFDNLNFSGSYGINRDSLKWSTVSTGGLFRLFKGMTNITWNVTFDPYIADAKGQRINQFVIKEKGRLVRTTQLGLAFNTGFTVRQLRDFFNKKKTAPPSNTPAAPAANSTSATPIKDDLLSIFNDLRVSHRISFNRQLIPTGFGTARDTFLLGSHNIDVSGSIPLTSKWSLDIDNISYNFSEKSLVYPSIGFTRDLHCWQLSLRWQPDRGTYAFFIGVKPGSLEFLKVPYRRNIFDAQL
jgi:hypothetical protein